EPEWVAPSRWRHGRADPVELYVEGTSAGPGPHPLFDEPAWLTAHPEAADHPGRALGHWLAQAGPDHPLPGTGPGSRTTLGALRAALEAVTVGSEAQRPLAG